VRSRTKSPGVYLYIYINIHITNTIKIWSDFGLSPHVCVKQQMLAGFSLDNNFSLEGHFASISYRQPWIDQTSPNILKLNLILPVRGLMALK
jgi:hypothetical protein